ncbi:MAG: glycosyltransferase [Spirochaeta sp. LUC14_002_19_P3]|nr:MAG: glycosyltransferase [Spirochaeta sp. LUC14_002_19_P3]
MKLSVCIPVYNGASTIGPLVDEIRRELGEYDLEIILVNDASPNDNSEAVCSRLARELKEVRFIGLRRNYGEHNAVMCALTHSTGDYAVILDDDGQNPPSCIHALLEKAQTGVDVVYSRYPKKRHHFLRNLGSRFNNAAASWLMDKPKNLYLSSFKVISRAVVDEIIKYKGPVPYIDGLIFRATNSAASVEVEHKVRVHGRSNYTLKKLLRLWLAMFINFSQKPLRVAMGAGLFFSVISIVLAIIFFIERIQNPDLPLGWATLILTTLFIGSMQLIFLGLIGEYVGKIYLDINGTPQWTIKTRID